MTFKLSKSDRHLVGDIYLDGSKSISNRALMIRALCGVDFDIKSLSTSLDTQLMEQLLATDGEVLDAGAAGTTFRFLTAYLAAHTDRSRTLTGSERMKQRPIGLLVEALRKLGANIEYLENEGYPPLRIHPTGGLSAANQLSIPANTSSQYLSALLMIAPTLPNGLELELMGNLVSRPYVEMTLLMMAYFGVGHEWEGDVIRVPPGKYQPRPFNVEADWSAASYYYAMAAFSDRCDLRLHGLFSDSWQGDSALAGMMQAFGVESIFYKNTLHLTKLPGTKPFFEWDFLPCPDVAQTLAVVCGGLGVHGLFSGLETLRIKETDRIAALQNELAKVQVFLSKLPDRFSQKADKEFFMIEGKAVVADSPVILTYEDHRMAMAFSPLSMLGDIKIEHPAVVEKSYPAFWEDLKSLGFVVELGD
ncbi:MAG: 3-phosphoshikimate 1-carboxyvinyltransferase [Saprospiraceae bacterium]|nr:3-phosphoshikimate 1-carboxyvinyltransferase [Saprospiraceae bacterium]MCF8251520.1 3-phosphoshikimate 1-carboxyvinyltransferase [Saprospiraceae bacterium]MCF8280771.1 3-phosphoshikimate 1-carboxyvinyltransferase [Bacteroidales bacterium]MCF8313380.1 3-phosphoshikimate 1-carboxyvinyltransferase [Saprospiraceae bacterium]MCF8441800.1 3-phosphoshikimate 1-carboxyvinyltransferase [Saprospiraceae bacterium]